MFAEIDMQFFYEDLISCGYKKNEAISMTLDTFRKQYNFCN